MFWVILVFITNMYVLYLKTCDGYGIPKVRRMTHPEFRKVIASVWINPEVHVEEWKAKEAASITNDTFRVRRGKRVGDNKVVSPMTMYSSF